MKERSFLRSDEGSSIIVQLAVDTDRNGIVEFEADQEGKEAWSSKRGALFLNNIDSDENSGKPDNTDEVVNGPEDLKDLAEIKLKKMSRLPSDTKLGLSINPESRQWVRIYIKSPSGEYKLLDLNSSPNIEVAQVHQNDLELRIEAKSFASPEWDGTIQILAVADIPGKGVFQDSVKMKVAPFILLSNLNKGKTLYVREYPGRNDEFIKQLKNLIPATGSDLYIIPAGEPYRPNHIWCQDAMEIGYSEIPGQQMSVVMNSNRNNSLDQFPKDKLLGPNYGWLTYSKYRPEFGEGEGGNSWIDWFGNLEVSPPLPSYPMGRIYYGVSGNASLDPTIVKMLEAQGVQGPALALDTGWLLIKHVDELVCFVPSGDVSKPFKALVPDTSRMIELVEKWVGQGKGDQMMLEPYPEKATLKSFMENKKMIEFNKRLQQDRIEPVIDVIKKEFALTEDEIIRIPSYFHENGKGYIPNIVNSAVLNGYFLAPNPFGPKDEGGDLMQHHIQYLLKGIPLKVVFLDDIQYHKWCGNTHCATNVRREGFAKSWWELIPFH